MKHIKSFESIILSDINNIRLIKNEKYLKILEYYCCFDTRYIELNIPIDIYYGHNRFSIEKEYDLRHYYVIGGMWSNFRDKNTNHGQSPYFLINIYSTKSVKIDVPDWSEFEERIIVRDEENYYPIIDIIYDFVMKHQEVVQAKKFNL